MDKCGQGAANEAWEPRDRAVAAEPCWQKSKEVGLIGGPVNEVNHGAEQKNKNPDEELQRICLPRQMRGRVCGKNHANTWSIGRH
jgi:hypothetical protein